MRDSNSAAQVSMRLNTGRTPAARRRLATSAAERLASSPSRSSEKPFFLSSSSALASFGRPSLRTTASHSTSCSISRRNHGSYFEACAISSTDRPWRNAWAITRMRSGVGRASAPTIADLSGAPLISISLRPVRPVSIERSAFCSDSWKVRPIDIASPTLFIEVVSIGSAPGNFSKAKRGILVTT